MPTPVGAPPTFTTPIMPMGVDQSQPAPEKRDVSSWLIPAVVAALGIGATAAAASSKGSKRKAARLGGVGQIFGAIGNTAGALYGMGEQKKAGEAAAAQKDLETGIDIEKIRTERMKALIGAGYDANSVMSWEQSGGQTPLEKPAKEPTEPFDPLESMIRHFQDLVESGDWTQESLAAYYDTLNPKTGVGNPTVLKPSLKATGAGDASKDPEAKLLDTLISNEDTPEEVRAEAIAVRSGAGSRAKLYSLLGDRSSNKDAVDKLRWAQGFLDKQTENAFYAQYTPGATAAAPDSASTAAIKYMRDAALGAVIGSNSKNGAQRPTTLLELKRSLHEQFGTLSEAVSAYWENNKDKPSEEVKRKLRMIREAWVAKETK
jgi:hypothetical protein